jgi:hypothetical protein
MKKDIWPKVGPTAQKINEQLKDLPPAEVNVLPDIITRQPTPADKEKAKKPLSSHHW